MKIRLTDTRQMPYFPDMPELSLKKLDESLMRAVKVEAAKQGLSSRDFVIKALSIAVGWEKPMAPPFIDMEPKKSPKIQKTADWEKPSIRAGIVVDEAPKQKCPKCGGHLAPWGAGFCCFVGCGRKFSSDLSPL